MPAPTPATRALPPGIDVAVCIPCFNEAPTIAGVIADFRAALPHAHIYVCDNASTDATAAIARDAGATVLTESLPGKGNAVRRLFAAVDADVYLLADGDRTYHAADAPRLVAALVDGDLDMVTATRILPPGEAYRRGHRFGSAVLSNLVGRVFGNRVDDLLSGYRAFSHRFVSTFPSRAAGFEIETELTVHALEMRLPISQIESVYTDRPAGSASKLHTFRDGWRILRTILALLREERPLQFFGALGLLCAAAALALAVPIVIEYADTGLVPRLPTAVLATGLAITALLSGATGLILDTVTRGRQEAKRLAYLQAPGVRARLAARSASATSRPAGAPIRDSA